MSPCVLVWSWFLGVKLQDSYVSMCTGVVLVPRCDASGQLCLPVYWRGPWFLCVTLVDSCVSLCTGVVPGS